MADARRHQDPPSAADWPRGKGRSEGKGKSFLEEQDGWEEDFVEQYEFSYTQYIDELYGTNTARQVPMQPSSTTFSFPAILDAEASGYRGPTPLPDRLRPRAWNRQPPPSGNGRHV